MGNNVAVASRILLTSAALLVVSVAGAALVAYTWQHTRQQIETNERDYSLRALNQIVPAERYDNPLFDDTTTVSDELLGVDTPLTVYRARRQGEPVAAILNVVAPDGYSGPIRLLVGINYDGTLAGVRVAWHSETPGLGDKIEIEKSNWITSFDGRSLGNPDSANWAVRQDGGVFDALTGATITPRAVVTAVRDALLYFEANREQIFAGGIE